MKSYGTELDWSLTGPAAAEGTSFQAASQLSSTQYTNTNSMMYDTNAKTEKTRTLNHLHLQPCWQKNFLTVTWLQELYSVSNNFYYSKHFCVCLPESCGGLLPCPHKSCRVGIIQFRPDKLKSKPRSDQDCVPLLFKCLEKALVNSSELTEVRGGGSRSS